VHLAIPLGVAHALREALLEPDGTVEPAAEVEAANRLPHRWASLAIPGADS
jgi:hypothetical protein